LLMARSILHTAFDLAAPRDFLIEWSFFVTTAFDLARRRRPRQVTAPKERKKGGTSWHRKNRRHARGFRCFFVLSFGPAETGDMATAKAAPRSHEEAVPESRTLRSHRVVGSVVDDAGPATAFYGLGGEGFACLRVGEDAFQVVRLEKLTVQVTSPRLGRRIVALACVDEWTYAAMEGAELWSFERSVPRERLRTGGLALRSLLRVGPALVGFGTSSSSDDDEEAMCVWETAQRGAVLRETLRVSQQSRRVTAATHPPTYVNKVLLGSSSRLELWNIRSGKKVHVFRSPRCGEVSALEPSGVVDVVAVGYADGAMELLHARRDEVLFRLDDETPKAAVTALAFARSGPDDQTRAVLVAGSRNGV